MNRSKQKGTAWESAIVDYLKRVFPRVERRTLAGTHDRGDIAGIPGLVVEAKNCSAINLAAFVDEANREAINDGGSAGVVWIKRRGKTCPGDGYVCMDGRTFVDMLVAVEHARSLDTQIVAAWTKERGA